VGGEIAMPMLAVDRVSFNYPNQRSLFRNVDFGLNMSSRIALVGANGTGKSTLLKLMLQLLDPVEGEVRQSRMCRVGVYNQHSCDQLAVGVELAKGEKLTPVTYLMHKFPEVNYQQVRNMLGRFGLEGHHHEQEIATLSGGQKSRVVFVELGMQVCRDRG
jgi:ATP-binding cassette subfamily F protein 1